MRLLALLLIALAAPIATAQAAAPVSNDWSPQIPSLRLAPPLVPDTSLYVPGGYTGTSTGSGGGGYQFGNNIAAPSGAFYALFQKGAFPFHH